MQSVEQQLDGYLRRYLDPEFIVEQTLAGAFFPDLGPELCAQAVEEVLEPIRNLVLLPGKRWRPMLALFHLHHALSLDGKVEAEEAAALIEPFGPAVALVELLHNATLIADDIEDDGKLRRGMPALHLSYGVDRALNACNWCYFIGSALLRPLLSSNELLALRLQSLSAETLNSIHLGQGLDIRWHREHAYVPTAEQYFAMATLKTGVLAGFAAELGCLCAKSLENLEGFENLGLSVRGLGSAAVSAEYSLWLRVGRAFQVMDDLINITVGNPGKLRGDDLLEGKKSLPLCLFVHGGLAGPELDSTPQAKQRFLQDLLDGIQRDVSAGQAPDLVLNAALAELLSQPDAIAALHSCFSWLEAEFAVCRSTLEQLYQLPLFSAEADSTVPALQLLSFVEQLAAQLQLCREFLAGL